ncbi:copper resistance protein CopC [Kibdelosporangium lantanae]
MGGMHLWRTLLVTVVAFLALATPASAHVRLLASDPQPGQELARPPQSIRLTFDSPLTARPVITLTGPADSRSSVGQPSMDGQAVTVAVDSQWAPAGEYVVEYQATGADGHSVPGEVRFKVTATSGTPPPAAAAGGTNTPPVPASPQPPAVAYTNAAGGVPVWIWILAAAVVVGGFGVWWVRHKRSL